MNLPPIDLVDPAYCNGCPCSMELYFQAHCLLFRLDIALDKETKINQDFMKRIRPDICVEKCGL